MLTMDMPLQKYLDALLEDLRPLDSGNVATYIPELAKVAPDQFGICMVTTDGHIYVAGDADNLFTLQSISKPLVYAAALADKGATAVMRKIGVEPTGDAFNSVSLHPVDGTPLNPMINAGAIAATELVAGDTPEEQWERILSLIGTFAGRPLDFDESVYQSESETGFRNRAIGWMLRNSNVLEADPTSTLENYFKQCSILVTCRDLGLMAATLANNGVHPLTKKVALAPEHVTSLLSVMSTCGMYDYAGSWLFEVGMPAKSGVGGGILAVLPGRFGIGVFSPRLDAKGNSVRGIAACRRISQDFGLHLFSGQRSPRLVIRREYSGADASSRHARGAEARKILAAKASRIRVIALQGEIALASAEFVGRHIAQSIDNVDCFILDMHRVNRLDNSAARLFHETRRQVTMLGKSMVFSCIRGRPPLAEPLKRNLAKTEGGYLSFEDNDTALEWCEEKLLGSDGRSDHSSESEDFGLFNGLNEDELGHLHRIMQVVCFTQGNTILSTDEENDDRIFLINSGQVSILMPLLDGTHQRLATLSSGMTFGEMAMLGQTKRTATVHADTDVKCKMFRAAEFDRLALDRPHIKIVLLQNLSSNLGTRLSQANHLISILAS
jgi:glutaminase